MDDILLKLQHRLIEGQKLAQEGSYERRMPNRESLILLRESRKELKNYLDANPNAAIGYRLLAQAEEYLLNYKGAFEALSKAIELTGEKSNKDLKKIAQLKEDESNWVKLSLKPDELEMLGKYLDNQLAMNSCDDTLKSTNEWLNQNISKAKKSKVIKYFRNNGGGCDCEVLANIVGE